MKKLQELKKIKTKPELAKLLNINPSLLTYTLYVLKPEDKYVQFDIPKKNGGQRTINAPIEKLKSIQSALSNLLLDCLDEINREKFPKSELANPSTKHSEVLKVKCNSAQIKQPSLSHGFERNRSIITNAMLHLGKKSVLNIDLLNFFESFNFGRVRGFFIKNKDFGLDPHIATVIAQIACHNNQLPQGSPCSPVITNLITHTLDIRLAALASRYSCIYTRYADDITFSTREKVFPSQIMQEENGIYTKGKKLHSEIRRSGFTINDKKTRIQYKDSRQNVTGLVVNKKPNVKNEYWRTVRAQCNSLFKEGKFTKKENGMPVEGNINELEGQLNFIDQLDYYNRLRQKPALNPKYHLKADALANGKAKQRRYLFSSRERTFSQFLFYRLFYANDNPTILTEGKTDNIYLKAALNVLSSDFPQLAKSKTENKPYELLLHFLNYTKRTRFLLELYGGVSYLRDFIIGYKANFKRYQAPKPNNPVIIIADNDEGVKSLVNYVLKVDSKNIFPKNTDKPCIRKSEFTHIFHNLYLVLTPLGTNNCETDIEYFFKDIDRLRKYNGKCFNTVEHRDSSQDLNKDSFANQIIKKYKNNIDFNGFKPLFKRLVQVIEHYDTIK